MIVLPMAGLSQRFVKAGYALPKYMLKAGADSIFMHVLRSFQNYFAVETFLFICRNEADTPSFIQAECKKLGIQNIQIVTLGHTTRGQAETVALGLQQMNTNLGASMTIFNIDTIRAGFKYPPTNILSSIDGYLEVFKGKGDNWSFARTHSASDATVVETAEKHRISDLCSTGLYDFRHASDFMDTLHEDSEKPQSEWAAPELYVAPLYNNLIQRGKKILAVEIPADQLIPCGIPEEYEAFKRKIEG